MDYNVPEVVVSTLSGMRHPEPTKCLGSLNTASVAKLPVRSQIELVNRKLRIALGVLNTDTEAVRGKIYDYVEYDEWVTIFTRDIAPAIVQLNA